ncbi:Immunoglobulin subtype,Immunoglobulin-like domain,Immunoglobulin-like fold,Immunoglobulin subtype [Cinara cedri]|uniref:Immunoglobulin subtype,Immunoglobulin-like domain,Immunoglobulin-like fold,Immunoglobulin subtype n=1 Tax=Cinara cedri TaxID=506608 RepID=A0A5E4N5L1_9HEMI|nr:Immunoglobulin subtype,Immunoglobulin-like domain,Immunoglobulin-like fold,Immunoglobulin subtype [Cinara cedri]
MKCLLLLLVLIVVQTSHQFRVAGSAMKKKVDEQSKTYFENVPQNVFASAGQNVLLPCRVRHLNDQVVSWIRMRDLHILTSSLHLYTNDDRFGIQHPLRESAIWNLQIRDVSPKDMGSYECQVNTEPKIKFLVNLTVFESDVMIGDMGETNVDEGEQSTEDSDDQQKQKQYQPKTTNYEPLERRMMPGGSITFTCRIGLTDQVRQNIQWYHYDKLISITDRRGGLSVETERSSNFFASRLTLASVTRSDSGKYTCRSGNKNSTTFTLHVVSPANEFALRDGLTSEASSNFHSVYVMMFSIMVVVHLIFAHSMHVVVL